MKMISLLLEVSILRFFATKMLIERLKLCIYNLINYINFKQQNIVFNHSNILLNLINTDKSCELMRNAAPFVLNDKPYYPALVVCFQINTKRLITSRKLFYHHFIFLSTHWSFIEKYNDVFYDIMDKHVPLHNIQNSKHLRLYIKSNKTIFHNKYRKSGNRDYREEFEGLKILVKFCIQ